MDEWTNRWMDGWMDGRTDRRMDGQMDGLMNGWVDIHVYYTVYIYRSPVINIMRHPLWGRNQVSCYVMYMCTYN